MSRERDLSARTERAMRAGPSFPEDEGLPARRLSFLAYIPCPIRAQMRDAICEFLADDGYRWYVPGGCGGEDPYEDLWKAEDADALPELVASLGFGDFFRPEFVRRFLDAGVYEAMPPARRCPEWIEARIDDPLGIYTPYAVFAYVLLVDLAKLGARPVPRRWSDLLDPSFESSLGFGGSEDEMAAILPVYVEKEYGEEGLRALARNTRGLYHSAEMAKAAGSADEGPAVFVLPWFFADARPDDGKALVVWPEEGALTSPLYFLAKKRMDPRTRSLAEFLLGPEIAAICRKGLFPAASSAGLAPGAPGLGGKLLWIGWDFVRAGLRERAEKAEAFLRAEWKAGKAGAGSAGTAATEAGA